MSNFLTDDDLKLLESHAEILGFKQDDMVLSEKHENTGAYGFGTGRAKPTL